MIEVSVFADEVSKNFTEAIDLCKRAGASCIELRGGIWGHAVQNCSRQDVERMKRTLIEYGSSVAVIGSPVGKCDMDDPDEYATHLRWFDRMCELAGEFDTKIIRGFAFWTPDRQRVPRPDMDDIIDRIADRLAPIAERAKQENVYFCLESEGSTNSGTCREIAQIIDAVTPNDNLMVAWDCNNAARLGEHPMDQGYPAIKERIKHVHVKPDSHMSIETVADTEVRYAQVFEQLLDDGYDGMASVEHWGSRWLMLEGVRQTAQVLAEVQADGD